MPFEESGWHGGAMFSEEIDQHLAERVLHAHPVAAFDRQLSDQSFQSERYRRGEIPSDHRRVVATRRLCLADGNLRACLLCLSGAHLALS